MKRFVEGTDRGQSTLFPECLEDWIDENNPVRVIDVFVDELDLGDLEFDGVSPEATGRPSYHPSVLLKLYIYGYLNRVQSSRRLEREAGAERGGDVADGSACARSQDDYRLP
jgi:transposase